MIFFWFMVILSSSISLLTFLSSCFIYYWEIGVGVSNYNVESSLSHFSSVSFCFTHFATLVWCIHIYNCNVFVVDWPVYDYAVSTPSPQIRESTRLWLTSSSLCHRLETFFKTIYWGNFRLISLISNISEVTTLLPDGKCLEKKKQFSHIFFSCFWRTGVWGVARGGQIILMPLLPSSA